MFLNIKVQLGAFNQENALLGAFSVIVKLCVILISIADIVLRQQQIWQIQTTNH